MIVAFQRVCGDEVPLWISECGDDDT